MDVANTVMRLVGGLTDTRHPDVREVLYGRRKTVPSKFRFSVFSPLGEIPCLPITFTRVNGWTFFSQRLR